MLCLWSLPEQCELWLIQLSSSTSPSPNSLTCSPVGASRAIAVGQVWDWLYKKLAVGPAEMTNLPKDLRERLAIETSFNPLERVYEQRSSDGQTVKWLFRLPDGLTIETVLMLYDDVSGSAKERRTVCISTQAGCAMGVSSARRGRRDWRGI